MKEGGFALGRKRYLWDSIFEGRGIDIGCGPDKLPLDNCIGFDEKDGDANHLSKYFPANHFDYAHGSQCLEHMRDPAAALRDWITVVRPRGFIVQTVPCWELYEGMVWPSRSNPDHKSTWSMWQKDSPAPIHCKLPEWLNQFGCEVLLCRLIDDNYDYKIGTRRDQTWRVEDYVEAFLEVVLRKP